MTTAEADAHAIDPRRGADSPYADSAGHTGSLARIIADGLLGFFLLLVCVSTGQAIRGWTHVPLPGPVIGLALLAVFLALFNRVRMQRHTARIEPVARLLLSHMGLLFVPAGAGIIMEWPIIRAQWLPITAALLGSTFICLISTGWLMHVHLLGKDAKDEAAKDEHGIH